MTSEGTGRPGRGLDPVAAAAALSWLLGGIGLVLLDVRVGRVDLLSDPVGYAVAAVGAWRLWRATPSTPWSTALVVLAPVAVASGAAVEVGAVLHGTATGITAGAGLGPDAPSWVATAAATTTALTGAGVLLLARHLRGVLDGIASDRWRQVTIAWVAFVVLGVVALATGAIELIVLAAATGLIAAVLLVLSLLATRRALEEEADTSGQVPGHP